MATYTMPSEYPNLRMVLAPQYAFLPSEQIEALIDNMFGEGTAERYENDLEDVFNLEENWLTKAASSVGKTVSSAAKDVAHTAVKAAPVVANVAGGAIKGAAAGSSLGLPGIIGGAVVGGVGTGLGSYAHGSLRDVGNVLGTATALGGQFTQTGQLGGSIGGIVSNLGGGRYGSGGALNTLNGIISNTGRGGSNALLNGLTRQFGGTNATGQLLSLLQRPETLQALLATQLGAVGRTTVPVGSRQIPVSRSAFLNLIRHLSEQAIDETAGLAEGVESELHYMIDEGGEYVGDPAVEQERSSRVWGLLNEALAERLLTDVYEESEYPEDDGYLAYQDIVLYEDVFVPDDDTENFFSEDDMNEWEEDDEFYYDIK